MSRHVARIFFRRDGAPNKKFVTYYEKLIIVYKLIIFGGGIQTLCPLSTLGYVPGPVHRFSRKTINENVRRLGRRFVAAGGRVRRVFGAVPSAARVGGPERQRRSEERGSVRTRETGRCHARQQLHDQTVRGKSAVPGQRSVTVLRSNSPEPDTTWHQSTRVVIHTSPTYCLRTCRSQTHLVSQFFICSPRNSVSSDHSSGVKINLIK